MELAKEIVELLGYAFLAVIAGAFVASVCVPVRRIICFVFKFDS